MEIDQVQAIYRDLPMLAQREALDFMLFLKQRYGDAESPPAREDATVILGRLGFIGSLDAEPDLSANYKEELTQALESKHGYH